MSHQFNLFDPEDEPEARARSTDPQESHDAAKKVNVTRIRRLVLWALSDPYGPASHEELCRRIGAQATESGIRGRCRDLVVAKMVKPLKRKGLTRAGNECNIWALADYEE